MKLRITLSLMALSLTLSSWPLFTSRAMNGKTGAGQQVGKPFRPPAIAAGSIHNLMSLPHWRSKLSAGVAARPMASSPSCPGGNILYVNAKVAGGTGDGSSWANAYSTLMAALAATENCANVTQIWVAQGKYKPSGGPAASFYLKNGLAIYGGFSGNGTETQLSERNPNPATNHTVLSGDLNDDDIPGDLLSPSKVDNSFTIVQNYGVNNTAILDGFTISGSAYTGTAPDETARTCGMYNLQSSPTLRNLIFSENIGAFGGGMTSYDGSPTLTNITFNNNIAYAAGGMYNETSSPTLTNVTFSGNSFIFDGVSGTTGGMSNSSDSNATLTNVIFSGNQGNGLSNRYSSTTLTNVTFSGNQGSGMYNVNSSAKVRNCILWGDGGGEIVNDSYSLITVSYSLVQGGYPGTGNLADNPQFLTSVPGPAPSTEGNLRPGPGSPAINAGDNYVSNPSLPATDLDGNPRVQNGRVEMGAYEKPNALPTITAASVTRTVGSPTSNAQIATVNDAEDNENILNVTATPLTGSGVMLSGLRVDANGNVTANVATACNATNSTFTLQVTDSDSSASQTTLTVTIGPPDTNLVSTPPATSGSDVTFSFTSTDTCSTPPKFECQLDNGGWSACTSPQSYTNLAAGAHKFAVRAKDAFGNVDATPATYTWTVFTSTCGTVVNPILLPAATRGASFVQTLSGSPTGSYVFSLLSGTLPPGVNLVNTLGIYSLRGTPTTAGSYTFTIKAKKNTSTCEGARTYTVVVP